MHNYKSIAPWRGCPDIMFGYYNDYADPDLLYIISRRLYCQQLFPTWGQRLARCLRNQGVIVQTKKGKLWTMNSNYML